MSATTPVDHRIAAPDGLTLHVRDRPGADPAATPVVCLPGLSRSLEDFEELAARLAAGRRVVAISARGRGLSDRDPDPARYDVRIESADVLAVIDRLAIPRAAFVGTSRGGVQAMMIAAIRPACVAAVALNDVGPVIEQAGLKRIRDYLAPSAPPTDWNEAAERIARRDGPWFPKLARADFDRIARRTWREGAEGLEPAWDPAIHRTLAGLDFDKPLPPLWGLFEALKDAPVMVVRGALSDVLSAGTVREMAAKRPDLVIHEVPDEGHAPLLADQPAQDAIERFLASTAS